MEPEPRTLKGRERCEVITSSPNPFSKSDVGL